MTNLKRAIGIGLLVAVPLLSFAQVTGVQQLPTSPVRSFQDVIRVLNTLLNWLFTLLLVVATFFILYAAYLYLTAGGDAEKVKTASNQLIYAAIALGVAFVSQGIRFIVEQLLQ